MEASALTWKHISNYALNKSLKIHIEYVYLPLLCDSMWLVVLERMPFLVLGYEYDWQIPSVTSRLIAPISGY